MSVMGCDDKVTICDLSEGTEAFDISNGQCRGCGRAQVPSTGLNPGMNVAEAVRRLGTRL